MLSPRPRRRGNLLGNAWGDLRRRARRCRLAPPHPRDRRELLQGHPRPALSEGTARHCAHLTHLTRAHCHD
eukprot:10708151-Alexandrium_andersonii.AAC.1